MDDLIISVEEARELLGKPAEDMDDIEIIKLIKLLDDMAVQALKLPHKDKLAGET